MNQSEYPPPTAPQADEFGPPGYDKVSLYPPCTPQLVHSPNYSQASANAAGYAPAAQPSQIVITQQPRSAAPGMVCRRCGREILVAATVNEFSCCQHFLCCLMFLTVGCTLCSCLPYCVGSLANVRHECPWCHTRL